LIGTLTATVASFFMQEHADRHADAHKEQLKAAHEDLGARMDRLEALLVTATGGTPANTDSTDASLADVTAAPDLAGTLADTTAPASTVLATPAAEADPDRSTP